MSRVAPEPESRASVTVQILDPSNQPAPHDDDDDGLISENRRRRRSSSQSPGSRVPLEKRDATLSAANVVSGLSDREDVSSVTSGETDDEGGGGGVRRLSRVRESEERLRKLMSAQDLGEFLDSSQVPAYLLKKDAVSNRDEIDGIILEEKIKSLRYMEHRIPETENQKGDFVGYTLLVPKPKISERLADETFRLLGRNFKPNIVIFVSGERCYIDGVERQTLKRSIISLIRNTSLNIRVFSTGEPYGPANQLAAIMSEKDVREKISSHFRLTNIVTRDVLDRNGLEVMSLEDGVGSIPLLRKVKTVPTQLVMPFDEMIVLDGPERLGYEFLETLAGFYHKKSEQDLSLGGIVSAEELDTTFSSTIRLVLHLTSNVSEDFRFKDLLLLSIETNTRSDPKPPENEKLQYIDREGFPQFGQKLIEMMRITEDMNPADYTDRDLYREIMFHDSFQGDLLTAIRILETTAHLNILIPLAVDKERFWFFDILSRSKQKLKGVLTQGIIADLYMNQSDFLRNLMSYIVTSNRYRDQTTATDFETLAPIVRLLKVALPDEFTPMYDAFRKADSATKVSKDSYDHILMHACLNMKQRSIDYFWGRSKVGVAGTMAMVGIFHTFAEDSKALDYKSRVQARELAQRYKRQCLNLLETCARSRVDRYQVREICLKSGRFCGQLNMSSVDMAVFLDFQEFLANEACQMVLMKQWMGKLSLKNKPSRYLVALFIPNGFLYLRYTNDRQIITPDVVPVTKKIKGKDRRTKYWDYIGQFLESSFVKFCYTTIFMLLFVAFFSYALMFGYHRPFRMEDGWNEVVLWTWQVILLGEEVSQALHMVGTPRVKLKQYFLSAWNILDLGACVLMLCAASFRITASEHEDFDIPAKSCYAVSLLIHYIKLFHVFSLVEVLGPKIIMIGEMLKDVLVFMGILIVYMLGFGIGLQFLINGDNENLVRDFGPTVKSIFDHTYWPMFGEIGGVLGKVWGDVFPEVEDDALAEVGLEGAEGVVPHELYRRQSRRFFQDPYRIATSAYFAVYIFITNIVLLNLLIAMFSYTFTQVQEKSDKVFKIQRFKFQREFTKRRALLPAPFSALWFLGWLVYKTCCCLLWRGLLRAEYEPVSNQLEDAIVDWQFSVKETMLIRQREQRENCT